ncbi:MAG: DUF6062 family protein [Sphaerochaetaceae bacterium]|jgi:hypothetical protein
MKLELQTIPVWDAVQQESECHICHLMKQAEQDCTNYYLGSSVMNPSTRVNVNQRGFCHHHWHSLLEIKNTQGLSLIEHTHLGEMQEYLTSSLNTLIEDPLRKKGIAHLTKKIQQRTKGCLICSDMNQRLIRYLYTTVVLYEQDETFKEALSLSKGVCLYHLPQLLEAAELYLSKSVKKDFISTLSQLTHTHLKRLEQELWWMTQKFKSENKEKGWNNSEDVHRRYIQKLTGEGRLYVEMSSKEK